MGNILELVQKKKAANTTSDTATELPSSSTGAACSTDVASLGDVVCMKRQFYIQKSTWACPADMACLPKEQNGKILSTTYVDKPVDTTTTDTSGTTDTSTNSSSAEGYRTIRSLYARRY